MFTAALFAIAKTWEQTKCPLIEEWIKCGVCVYIYTPHTKQLTPYGLSYSVVPDYLRPHGACQAPLSMGILQARILEWVATPSTRRSFQPRDWTQVSCTVCRFFTVWAAREAHICVYTHTRLLLSCYKNDTMTSAVTWMEPETVTLSEVREDEISSLYILIQRRLIEWSIDDFQA